MNSTRPSRGHGSSESQRQDTSHSGNDRIWLTRSSSPLFNPNRMLKKSANFVLASFRPSTYPRGYASALHSLRPCWTAFLNNLLSPLSTCGPKIRSVVPCISDGVRPPFKDNFPGGGEREGH